MEQQTDVELSVPDVAPTWEILHNQSQYTSDVRDDPTGGMIVHRCHPDGEAQDFFAFGQRFETFKGYVEKNVYLFDGPVQDGESPAANAGISTWDKVVGSFHMREGSHEDCAVCQGTADPDDLLEEVVDRATQQVGGEHNVAKSSIYGKSRDGSHRAVVYVDSHGMATVTGAYSVDNTTHHWDGAIVAHPYVQIARAENTGTGNNTHTPDETLRIVLKTWFPARGPGAEL